jgi:transcriptional regulator with XRE-family HTH domain
MPLPTSKSFGHSLRARRQELRLTLVALARRSGVSAAMLSEVERDRKSPSIRVACKIAEGLRCAVSELLTEDVPRGVTIEGRRERRRLVDPATGIERHALAPRLLARGIEVVWYVVPRGRSSGRFARGRPGRIAHATVVKGVLESITPDQRYRLRPGDSITYPAGVEHEFRNVGRGACEFLLVIDASREGGSSAQRQ